MHYLKITSKGWQGYNGQLNIIRFKDGVSTEPVPPLIADRIAGSVTVVACDADGNEIEGDSAVGIQYRLVSESASRAPIAEPLARQSDKDKSLEAKLDAARTLKAPVEHLYTRAELETVADEKGIKGLRVIGDAWHVKGKAIPALIEAILAAQSEFIATRNAALEKAGGPVRKHTLSAEEIEAQETAAEETLVALGYEGLAPEYQGPNDIVIPAETLINAALKNSGKSLTGWNNAKERDRQEAIEAELLALSRHYGVDIKPVEAPAEKPKEDEKPKQDEDPAKETSDEGEGSGDKGAEGDSSEGDASEDGTGDEGGSEEGDADESKDA